MLGRDKEVAISLGGSLIIPEWEVRVPYLRMFGALLRDRVEMIGQKQALVTGGGKPSRVYQDALENLGITDPVSKDTLGIHPTHTNAKLLVYALNASGIKAQYLRSPQEAVDPQVDAWVTGGTEAGQTTDAVVVDWASHLGIQTVFNATNTPYIYEMTPDGRIDKSHPISDMTWEEYFGLMPERSHVPGEIVPFGITASHKAHTLGITAVILDGNDLENLQSAFERKPFRGTIIHPNHS